MSCPLERPENSFLENLKARLECIFQGGKIVDPPHKGKDFPYRCDILFLGQPKNRGPTP